MDPHLPAHAHQGANACAGLALTQTPVLPTCSGLPMTTSTFITTSFARFGSPRQISLAAAIVSVLIAGASAAAGSAMLTPGPKAGGTSVTPEGWRVTPAGKQIELGPEPLAVAVTPDGALVLVEDAGYSDHALLVFDARSGALLQKLEGATDGSRGYYSGLAISRDGKHAYASDGAGSGVRTFRIENGRLSETAEIFLPGVTWPAGVSVSSDGKRLYVAGNLTDNLVTLDAVTGTLLGTVPTGHLPYGLALSRDERRVFVSSWGGNTVTVIQLESGSVEATVNVGTHPNAVAANPIRDEIYVANGDSDEISVIDGRKAHVLRTIDLQPFSSAPVGLSPNALTVSPDGSTLYVANAGFNDVAVIRLADGSIAHRDDKVAGLIPTGWYPSGVALDPSGRNLFVTNMKGSGIGPVAPDQYIAAMLRGSLSQIPVPSDGALAQYTRQVWKNVKLPSHSPNEATVIPDHVGGHTPIEHVIYVLKENRTYDQVLGDLDRGDGDPSVAIFGEDVTPNQHELARRFTTFDNFYCDGEVSADGWTWSSAANANTYNQKNWPLDYGYSGRLYDFGGFGDASTAAFPGRTTLKSFMWDLLAEKGISYRNYGFFVNGAPVSIDSSMPGLVGHTDLSYPGWDMATPDQVRIDEWLREFASFKETGHMPNVQFVYLPRDHTVGASPGWETPAAMVADNDLALGRLVDAVSHSRFWQNTVIFSVEDDAQDGPDHVDGHRTVALAISPYTQTAKVDSTFYSTVSMLRTIELIAGIGPMTQFDALATPLSAAFASRPNARPYRALTPTQSLTETTPSSAPLAAESLVLNFTKPDSANTDILNRAIWESRRGHGTESPFVTGKIADRTDND